MSKGTSFSLNYKLARCCYPGGEFDSSDCGLTIRPAYLTTNENLSKSIPMFNRVPRDVLTVAASGDQALLYAAAGAKYIDTFDITFSAKAIQDIKTVAISKFNYDGYINFLKAIHAGQCVRSNIMNVCRMPEVLNEMPDDSAEYVRCMSDCNIFSSGIYGCFDDIKFLPSMEQYAAMRKSVKRPFNFIWTDLADLHTKIITKYDVINTSNIFEWCGTSDVVPTLNNLFHHLKPGGYILSTVFFLQGYIENSFEIVKRQHGDCARVDYTPTMNEKIVTLQRVR